MSVETTGVTKSYTTDGATSLFNFPNYLWEPQNLVVSFTLAGVTTLYQYAARPGFTWAGVADAYGAYPAGGNAQIVDANGNALNLDAGGSLVLARTTPRTWAGSFIDNSAFPATTLEHAIDKLFLIAQEQQSGFLGLLSGPPSAGTYHVGDWFIVSPPVPGGPWGYVCTSVAPLTWNEISDIGL